MDKLTCISCHTPNLSAMHVCVLFVAGTLYGVGKCLCLACCPHSRHRRPAGG
jgi:hypothetical protein